MKNAPNYPSKFIAALFAAGLALGLAPILRAQEQTHSQARAHADSASRASCETLEQLQALEGEVSLLRIEIAALKISESERMNGRSTPGMRAAVLKQPGIEQAPPENTPAAAAPSRATGPQRAMINEADRPTCIV